MSPRPLAKDIDEYLDWQTPEVRVKLAEMRALFRELVPEATETISYAIPTFDLHGKHLVHFAGFAHHVSMYPVPHGPDELVAAVEPYRKGRGTLRFDPDQPLPTELMTRVVLQLREDLERRLG